MLKVWAKYKAKSRFDHWITDYHGVLFRHAVWLTGNQDIATDIVQETFFQAWRAMDSLTDSDKALPWLLTIMRRCVYREQRQQYRHKETIESLSVQDTLQAGEDGYRLLVIYSALAQLTINHREIFILHYFHGFSYEEISEQLEIPKGTVMSRLARARAALQKLEECSDEYNVVPLDLTQSGQENNG